MMKIAMLFCLFFFSLLTASDISEVREHYRNASANAEVAKQLYNELEPITTGDDPILIAYKGAVTTLMSKYSNEIRDKKSYFKAGKLLLEYAVTASPNNIEIRYIRMSVQENAPKIVGYNKNIQEDKQFILEHYKATNDMATKKLIKGYVAQSKLFEANEKQLF